MSDRSVERMERALTRLTRAAARCGDSLARSWALEEPGEPVAWRGDPLPDDVRRLLEWRKASALYLPTLQVNPWEDCARETQRQVPGVIWLSALVQVSDRGAFTNWDTPLAESLAELVELEAVLLERLPGSPIRGIRLEEVLSDWQPCLAPGPEELASCAPGTLFCAVDEHDSPMSVLKLGQRRWTHAYTQISAPGEVGELLEELRLNLLLGELQVCSTLEGVRWWRAALALGQRLSPERALDRLEHALSLRAPWLRGTLRPAEPEEDLQALERSLRVALPEPLRQLWQRTGGTRGGRFRYGCALLGPTEARRLQGTLQEQDWGLVPLLADEQDKLVCVDCLGYYAPAGALVGILPGDRDERIVLFECLEDWLEAFALELERDDWDPDEDSWEIEEGEIEEGDLDERDLDGQVRFDYPRRLSLQALQRVEAPGGEEAPVVPLELALARMEADSHGQRLMWEAARELADFEGLWDDQPHGPASLQVLRDWLAEQGTPLGTATLATLVSRVAPLMEE